MNKQPTLFVSHGGGPWPYIEEMKTQYSKTAAAFSKIPSLLPEKPKAVLVISGHWEEPEFTVSSSEQPPMIYDYFGFPEHTYKIRYPAKGSSSVAHQVQQLAEKNNLKCRIDSTRGFDHGTFVPLSLIFPEADVPVVSVSIKSDYGPKEHIEFGKALEPMRSQGVLIIASGLNYHNMRGFNSSSGAIASEAFEAWLNETISLLPDQRNTRLVEWESAPAARLAHPREDHLIPLMVASGAANSEQGQRLFADHVMGVVMASYIFK